MPVLQGKYGRRQQRLSEDLRSTRSSNHQMVPKHSQAVILGEVEGTLRLA